MEILMKKECRITFRLTDDLLDDLIRYALGRNLTLSKAVRTLIEKQKRQAA
jgi:hypothetical protein